jgi:hypothetical protein
VTYTAKFTGDPGKACTNLNFFGSDGRWDVLMFDASHYPDGSHGPPFTLELSLRGGPRRAARWNPQTTPELVAWFGNAQHQENGAVLPFLDWLIDNCPADMRAGLEKIMACGVVPLANPRREGDVEATANAR